MKTIHPAIAEHVMEENEKLRGLLRELREITSEYAWDADLEARVDAALTQQAEPDHVEDMRAMVEPAPAQDERENWSVALLQVAVVLEALRSSDSATRLANMDAGKVLGGAYAKLQRIRATHPAQTEQQPDDEPDPFGLIYRIDGEAVIQLVGDPHIADGMAVYAAPIAQTAPQCMAALERWQLVPVEPTPEMREAFHEATERYEDGFGESPDSQWQAMLRAAQGDKP